MENLFITDIEWHKKKGKPQQIIAYTHEDGKIMTIDGKRESDTATITINLTSKTGKIKKKDLIEYAEWLLNKPVNN